MRKITLAGLTILALAGLSLAVPPNQTNLPHPAATAVLPPTCAGLQDQYGVTVSPTSPTLAVSGSTGAWKAVLIQNQDATANLFFHYSQSMSTSVVVSTGNLGFLIGPKNIPQFFALQSGVTYYLMNDTSGTTPRNTAAVVAACR